MNVTKSQSRIATLPVDPFLTKAADDRNNALAQLQNQGKGTVQSHCPLL